MEVDQKAMQSFTSPCGKSRAYVENDMSLGAFHDFLMYIKGLMVDRMLEAHKQEVAAAEAQKAQESAE